MTNFPSFPANFSYGQRHEEKEWLADKKRNDETYICQKLQAEGKWVYPDEDIAMIIDPSLPGSFLISETDDPDLFLTAVMLDSGPHFATIMKRDFAQVFLAHENSPEKIFDYIEKACIQTAICKMQEEQRIYKSDAELKSLLQKPKFANHRQEYFVRVGADDDSPICIAIIQQDDTLSIEVSPREFLKLYELPPAEVVDFVVGKLYGRAVDQLRDENRVCQTYQQMQDTLMSPAFVEKGNQFLASVHPTNPSALYVGMRNNGQVFILQIDSRSFLDIWRLPAAQQPRTLMNKIHEEAIGSSLLRANWQQLKTALQAAITSQENIGNLASTILKKIQHIPETTLRLRACRSLLTELIDKPDSLAVVDAHLEHHRTGVKTTLETLGYVRDLNYLPHFLDRISITESDPKQPIKHVISSLEYSGTDPYFLDFAKRILSHIEALEQMGRQGIHKLNLIKILQISIIADTMLQKNKIGYIKKTEVGSPYSLTIEPAARKITILLKGKEGQGPIRTTGGCAKVYSVIEMGPEGALHAVQKVNKDNKEPISERELKYERMFGSLRSTCSYKKLVNGDLIDKTSMIKEAFDCDLLARMKQEPRLTLDEKINILASVAKNLQNIHNQGVMHNDIKILNVLWKKDKCEISDFGLSFEPSHMPSPSVYKGTYGTPEFSAPEMLKNRDLAPSFNQDIYAFGTMAYHLVKDKNIPWQEYITAAVLGVGSPRRPSSKAKTQALEMQQHIGVVIKRLKRKKDVQGLNKEEGLDLAIHRLLDPNPKSRISLSDFLTELEQIKQ